ncbi:MAG: glycosyltransferase family 2 protein [Myxococcales bacterium]|nr:glycosyltransferase family 2 protein [Myxococcales bacterium]
MERAPFVTVGIPCLNEEDFIESVVRRVLGQTYPRDRFEIIVADGGSTDRTREILDELAAEDPRVKWIDNPGRIQAAGMNAIIRRARGEIVVRLDAHADYADDYLECCVRVLEATGAENVGGAARTRAKTRFQQALCAALESPFGVGGSKYRNADNEGFVESVFNGAFRRRVFEEMGLYDPCAVTNEDAELNQRILQAGGRIYLSREIVAYYYPRDSYAGLAKQYFKYGMGRARTLLKHRELPSVRPLVPFAFVLGAVGTFAFPPLRVFAIPGLVSYGLATGVEALRRGRKVGGWAVPVVWTIFPVLHVSHGVGMGYGLWRYLNQPDWSEPERVPLRPEASSTEPA